MELRRAALRQTCRESRGGGPLTWGADQGLRLVDSRGRASHNATGVFAGPGEPSDFQLSLSGLSSAVRSMRAPRETASDRRECAPMTAPARHRCQMRPMNGDH
jgi:hypothetical protein